MKIEERTKSKHEPSGSEGWPPRFGHLVSGGAAGSGKTQLPMERQKNASAGSQCQGPVIGSPGGCQLHPPCESPTSGTPVAVCQLSTNWQAPGQVEPSSPYWTA